MKFETWWKEHKAKYKGMADWKDTIYTLQCTERGKNKLATAIKAGVLTLLAF